MKHRFENHDFTAAAGQVVDVTEDVAAVVQRSGVDRGVALVYAPTTTCAVSVNELEDGFLRDFEDFLDELAPADGRVRAGLLASTSQSIPVVDGMLALGTWQRVFLFELDRSRPRKVFVQVMGD